MYVLFHESIYNLHGRKKDFIFLRWGIFSLIKVYRGYMLKNECLFYVTPSKRPKLCSLKGGGMKKILKTFALFYIFHWESILKWKTYLWMKPFTLKYTYKNIIFLYFNDSMIYFVYKVNCCYNCFWLA